MYSPLLPTERRRWNVTLAVSLAVHCVVIFLVSRRPDAIFVQPSLVTRGDFGKSVLIYSPSAPAAPKVKTRHTQDALTYKQNALQFAPRYTGSRTPQKEVKRPIEEAATSARAGSTFGSRYEGSTLGSEVRPAIPTVFPDPPIHEVVAPGISGDVVVEITIDEVGNVIDARVLKSLGFGIEERVVATLRNWRFHPATKDGTPIPSKQDYRFHYPS